MAPIDCFEGEPEGTREAIMRATYRAFCRHGYADLTISRIGEEFPKSKSLLYHHYDGKDELLLEFLEFMLEHHEETVPKHSYEDARGHLNAVLDQLLADELDEEHRDFTAAMVELRGQAAHHDEYRDHFTRSDRYFHDRIAEIVREGIEEGIFRDVDPDRIASLLLTVVSGTMTRRATADVDDEISALRDELEAYVESNLLAGGSDRA